MVERLLDVSDLEPPEPLIRALAVADGLGEGQYLRMLHRREPLLLFDSLEGKGFRFVMRAGHIAPCEVFVWRSGDEAAQAEAMAAAESLPPFESD